MYEEACAEHGTSYTMQEVRKSEQRMCKHENLTYWVVKGTVFASCPKCKQKVGMSKKILQEVITEKNCTIDTAVKEGFVKALDYRERIVADYQADEIAKAEGDNEAEETPY